MVKNCIICGKEFNARGYRIICCSKECSKENARRYKKSYHKPTIKKKTCVVCGTEFETTNANQTCCSDECKEVRYKKIKKVFYKKAHPPVTEKRYCEICGNELGGTAARRFCSKKCYNKHRSEYRKAQKPNVIVKCVVCGREFVKTQNRKCCSDECSEIRSKQTQNRSRSAYTLRRSMIRKVNREIRLAMPKVVEQKKVKLKTPKTKLKVPKIIRKNCAVCGKLFETFEPNKKYCSKDCADVARDLDYKKFVFNNVAHRLATLPKYLKRCERCGKEFETTNPQKKYCSLECINKALHVVKKPMSRLDNLIEQAAQCGLSYGKYRAMLNAGKTFEELKLVAGS